MAVVFKGGTSGNREDALPPVPSSGSPQPVLMTETSGGMSGSIHAAGGASGGHGEFIPSLPTGGTIPDGSTDIVQQDINYSGPPAKDADVDFDGATSGNR